MQEIRLIYQRWLDGVLAQEDALFAIGDVLSSVSAAGGEPGPDGDRHNPRSERQDS